MNYFSWAKGTIFVIAALVVLTGRADAQAVTLRGTIESMNGDALVIRTREGESATVRLKDGAGVGAVVKAQLADIKPGLFVGATAMPGQGDALKALEVHIFPEAMRGIGAGFHPSDLVQGGSMTNGDISAVIDAVDGQKLTVAYKGGRRTILVDKATPIVALARGAPEDLKPGAGIVVFGAIKGADGGYLAASAIIGRDGVKPPM